MEILIIILKYIWVLHIILRYKKENKIPVVLHNGSNHDDHLIIKELEKQFECLGQNTKKYITYFVEIEKELENDKKIDILNKIFW